MTRRTGLRPTPPPAERHSDASVLDEATRPSAPEPDEERELIGPLARHGFFAGQLEPWD